MKAYKQKQWQHINALKCWKLAILLVLFAFVIVFTVACNAKNEPDTTPVVTNELQPQETTIEESSDKDQKNQNDIEEPDITEKTEEPDINTGFSANPWEDSALKENITENTELSPKEDFHLYVNHNWLNDAEIPAGYCGWSFFDENDKKIEEKEMSVINDLESESHDSELIRDLYKTALDWDERNTKGLTPLTEKLEAIQELKSLDEMTDLICDKDKGRFLSGFVDVSVEPAISDSSRNIVTLRIKEHMSPEGEKKLVYPQQQSAEKKFVSDMMELAGYSKVEAAQMYDAALMNVELYMLWNPQGTEAARNINFYEENSVVMSNDEVRNLTEQFPLMRVLEYYGVDNAEEYQVIYPETFKNLDQIYIEGNISNLKKYLIVSCVMNMAQLLNRDAENIVYDYYHSLYGIKDVPSDEEKALSIVEKYLDTPLNRVYFQQYDVSDNKNRVTELVGQIVDEYREMLEKEDWLSETTKKYAIEKLDSIKINAICPDEWDDYSDLDIEGLSYLDAIEKIVDFQWQNSLAKIGTAGNLNIWRGSVMATNAFYDPLYNSINICCGLADGDFLHDDISKEELYAGLGTIIAHEISHAFDTKGSLYDKNGNYVNWWTTEDYEAFQKKSDRLIKYFSNMTAWGNGFVNGTLICGETIADMAGMKVILQLAEKTQDFDYEKFFAAYAKHWRIISSKEYEQFLLAGDAHLLNYLRTNAVLQQFDVFLDTYEIKEGDTMYLAPEKRVTVW